MYLEMPKRNMRKTRKCLWRKKKVGGSNLPAPYFAAAGLTQPDAAAGGDILTLQPGGAVIRSGLPVQGYAVKGGFVPSVGEPFVSAAAQYITPLALFAGYKLMQRGKKATRRRVTRRRR
jgi:hypothetical protein